MNPAQLSNQIVMALNQTQFKWGEGLLEPVLSRVVVGPASPDIFNTNAPQPYAIVHNETGRDHEEVPGDLVEEARLSLYLFSGNATEQAGQAAVVGGNRAALGSSRGRGLLEIEPLIKAQLFNQLGLVARPRSVGAQPTAAAGRMNGLLAERALDIVATRIPSFPDYAPIRRLRNLSAARVTCSFDWAPMPSPRYDLVGYVYNSAAGATAPTDPTAGTFVAADGTKSCVFTILGTSFTNWTWELHNNLGNVSGGFSGATPAIAATNLAATISGLSGGTRFTATASGATVTVVPKSGGSVYALVGMALITPGESGTANQVTVQNNSGIAFLSAFNVGQRSFSFWWAYDFTKDPWTGFGVTPVAPNRYSGYETAQGGLVYIPASQTITVT